VSPLKLSLSVLSADSSQYTDGAIIDSRGEIPIAKRAEESKYTGYDLTDRDAVREILATRKPEASSASALTEALNDFTGKEELVIDERPKKQRKSIKLRLSMSSNDSKAVKVEEPPLYPQLDSPTTREAIAGMLSMSKAKLHPKMAVKASLKKKTSLPPLRSEEKMSRVHQDDDFIYPSLDVSDDEDISIEPKDEPWNPKMKMSHLQPKKDRPVRDSAKNIAIEKGLKKAAENRNILPRWSSGKLNKKRLLEKQKSDAAIFADDRNRARKPCTTAKQRLGKKLGLKF